MAAPPAVDAKANFATVWSTYVARLEGRKLPSAIRVRSVGPYLLKAFGALPPGSIRQAEVDKYERDRAAGRIGRPAKPGTIWLELNKLVTACNYAVRQQLISAADKPRFEMVEQPEARDRWMRREEAQRLFATAERERDGARLSRVERFLHIALETAARRRVIETLTWTQVDMEIGVIHFHRTGDRRTKKRRPSVPISRALRAVLNRAFAERQGNLVLDHDRPISLPFERIARLAGLTDVTPHVLRHTAATWMARHGVPLWQIAGVLGNSVSLVEKVYAKHCREGLAEAVETISAGARSKTIAKNSPTRAKAGTTFH
ncbi:site-specific integrase [Methylobacterium sp. Leaf456]|uniref:site-specific integrase n=1 Tax=Methylobacterium sp. Leaf456 TaxID=1736382 RepID=UPI000B2E6347|nr:site-specific integrase [Methylobacterium sp. Leaf456]